MSIQPGDKLPEVTFSTPTEEGPKPLASAGICGQDGCAVRCAGRFYPNLFGAAPAGFKDQAEAFKAKGVDTIACTSVNDGFVMKAWAKDQGITNEILMLGDGNGEFAAGLGLDFDGSGFGMGKRSQRYAMIVKDGVVDKVFVEAKGEFKVSAAEYVLEQL